MAVCCPPSLARRQSVHTDRSPGVLHTCKQGDPCMCATPRNRNRRRTPNQEVPPASASAQPDQSSLRTSSQILARIAELRPVLPRPSDVGPFAQQQPVSHALPARHRGDREAAAFSPYERAYGMTHQPLHHPPSYMPSNSNLHPLSMQTLAPPQTSMWGDVHISSNLESMQNQLPPAAFPSLCMCGDDCRCPGCRQHNPSLTATDLPPSNAYLSCNDPERCGGCLDCTILSLPNNANVPLNQSMYGSDSMPLTEDTIDVWLRQMGPPSTSFGEPPVDSFGQYSTSYGSGWGPAGAHQTGGPQGQAPSIYFQPPIRDSDPRSRGQTTSLRIPSSPSTSPSTAGSAGGLLVPNAGFGEFRSRSSSTSSSGQSSRRGSDVGMTGMSPVYASPSPGPTGRVHGMQIPVSPAAAFATQGRLAMGGGTASGSRSSGSPSSLSPSPQPQSQASQGHARSSSTTSEGYDGSLGTMNIF